MSVPADANPAFAAYVHPERLVSTEWLSSKLGNPNVKIVESDEDVLLYDIGHIPGAVKIDWHLDLNDRVTRDYIDGAQFAALMDRKGIRRDDTVVIYGDKSNWWAAYAMWVFTLFGHEDVRLLDGGRDAWFAEERETTFDVPETTTAGYPVVARDDSQIRAFKQEVLDVLGAVPLIDVRSPLEYTGERTHMPDYPEEGALRGGHIPTAVSIPWAKAAAADGRFRSRAELDEIYSGFDPDGEIIAYCRIGERSSHTWFVLTHLLGFPKVRNYDGSWTEWGNAVRVPIVKGEEPGKAEDPRGRRLDRPARSPRRDRRRFRGDGPQRQGDPAARVQPGVAGVARASAHRGDGARPRVSVACVPVCRRRRSQPRAAVLQRAGGGTDDAGIRVDPRAGPRRAFGGRDPRRAGRLLPRSRSGRGGESAAFARYVGDAHKDQTPVAGRQHYWWVTNPGADSAVVVLRLRGSACSWAVTPNASRPGMQTERRCRFRGLRDED